MRASNIQILMSALCVVCCVGVKPLSAQGLQRYQPATPTVSPYLSLDRFNTGGLPNYYTLVRPINRQRQINRQNQRLQRQQQAVLQDLDRAVRQPGFPQSTTGTSGRFLTSGTRSVYRDTLQFYPPVNPRR
ncbi:MAG: hypothetical protein AAGD11_16445 [Planctomycetota bacterium]